jgi:uncharacterized protein (DUF433 family)
LKRAIVASAHGIHEKSLFGLLNGVGVRIAFVTVAIDIGSLISRDPQIRGGRPCVAGTGVTVQRIATWYKLGLAPEEIVDRIGHLTLAQIHAALAHYHSNRDEIEECMAADEASASDLNAGSSTLGP